MGQPKKEMFTLDQFFPDIFEKGTKLSLTNLAKYIGASAPDLAMILGVHPSNVYKNSVSQDNEAVQKLVGLLTTLALVAKEQDGVKSKEDIQQKVMRWFATPNSTFGMKTPVEILKTGKFRKLQSYADDLLDGTLS